MKRFSRLILCTLLGAAATPAVIQADETMVYDLRVYENFDVNRQFGVEKDGDDGYAIWQWVRYIGTGYDFSAPEMFNSNLYRTDGYYDHVYYTPDLNLEAGTYKVYTSPRKKSSTYVTTEDSNLEIYVGQGEVNVKDNINPAFKRVAAYSGFPYKSIYSASDFDDLAHYECEFEISAPGAYKVAFHGEGAGFTLHETYIVKTDGNGGGNTDPDPEPVPDPVVPGAVSALSASVDGQTVTLSFTLPFEGTKGESLEGKDLKFTVYRDGEQIVSKSRQQAGAPVTYVDNDLDNGTYVYSVDVTLGEETGERASVSAEVKPVGGLPMETLDLPIFESFANEQFGNIWYPEGYSGDVAWIAVDALTTQLPTMSPCDNDGGMIVFHGWDGKEGDWARIATRPITKSSSTAPVFSFMFGHSGARATTDYVKVQIKTDNGDWQDVDDAKIYTYIPSLENGGWTHYKYSLEPYIAGCKTYQIGLLGVCERLNANIPIDYIQVYNAASRDVQLKSFEVPAEILAGNDLLLSVVVNNNGSGTLNPDDYTISVDTDYPAEVEFEKISIAPYSEAVVTAAVKVTAEEVLDGPQYSFAVTVDVPDNNNVTSLASERKTVNTAFADHKVPANLKGQFSGESLTGVTWESVKDLSHKDINISENFNDLPAHHQEEINGERVWIEGAKGNFNGFVSLDFDKMDGGSWYSTSGSEFQVFQDFMTGSMPQGHSGQYIGLTLPANIQQDDWLISPELNASETSVINFWARIAYIYRESDSYNNSIEVLYATEDYNPANPLAAFKHVFYTNTSKATTGDLAHDGNYHWLYANGIPSEAKYVALHFVTKSAMQSGVWVDRLSITEKDEYPLAGYYVYQRNSGRLNEQPLDKAQLSFALNGAQLDVANPYYVTALYGDGESRPSNMLGDPSGVDSVNDMGGSVISVINGGVMISGSVGETAEVYTLDGRKVAAVKTAGVTIINLEAGLYVVKAGAKTLKALVK